MSEDTKRVRLHGWTVTEHYQQLPDDERTSELEDLQRRAKKWPGDPGITFAEPPAVESSIYHVIDVTIPADMAPVGAADDLGLILDFWEVAP